MTKQSQQGIQVSLREIISIKKRRLTERELET
jgi:hypothetical protein